MFGKRGTRSAAAVLQALWASDGMTRRELELRLNLSRPTVERAVRTLERLDLIQAMGKRTSGVGRPATVFQLQEQSHLALGIDVELPGLTVAATDLRGEVIRSDSWTLTDGLDDPIGTLNQVSADLRRWLREVGIADQRVVGVGLGVPAAVADGQMTILAPNLPQWVRVPAQVVLEERLRLPVWVSHDVHCLALAEARRAGWEDDILLYLALRPGLHGDMRMGASLLLRGRPYLGAHGGGATLHRAFAAQTDLANLAPDARAERLVNRLLQDVVQATLFSDPHRVVIEADCLGESASAFLELFREKLIAALEGQASLPVEVVAAQADGSAGAQGAAVAVLRDLHSHPERLLPTGRR
ncbi:MAG: ROK family protein [Candidatus Bipolaricaulaceae bacterium]